MADPTLAFTVECGKSLKATIGGIDVVVTCQPGGSTTWTIPPPPGAGGGYQAFQIVGELDLIDLDAAVDRVVSGDLGDDIEPIDEPGVE